MRQLLVCLACLIALASAGYGQTTAVTATLIDPSSVTWVAGTCTAAWTGTGNPSTISGQSFSTKPACSVNGSGVMSVTVTDVAYISPPAASWKFCATPGIVAPSQLNCVTVAATGASESISTQIQAVLTSPSATGAITPSAYADSEVAAFNGAMYYSLTTSAFRCYAGGAWGACGGTGTFNALTGDANSTSTGGATTVVGINGVKISTLASGILYVTTATGVPSIATAAQVIAGLGSTPIINASAMTNFPTFNQNTTGTAANLTGCTPSASGDLCYYTGSAWLKLAGNASGTQYLQETSSGVPSWTTPSGSGTVTDGSGTTTANEFLLSTTTVHQYAVSTAANALSVLGAAPALTACSDESSTFTPATGTCYSVSAAVSTATPAASAFVVFTVTTTSAGSFALTGTTIADGGGCSSYISGTTLTLTASQTISVKSDGTNVYANCTATSGGSTGSLTGSGLTAYDAYYMSSGGLATAEANSATTVPAVCIASSTTVCVYSGVVTNGSWTWTQGGLVYISDATTGTMTQTAPTTSAHFVQVVGVATSTTAILVMPSLQVLTIQ